LHISVNNYSTNKQDDQREKHYAKLFHYTPWSLWNKLCILCRW